MRRWMKRNVYDLSNEQRQRPMNFKSTVRTLACDYGGGSSKFNCHSTTCDSCKSIPCILSKIIFCDLQKLKKEKQKKLREK